jgi:hypothetical protein
MSYEPPAPTLHWLYRASIAVAKPHLLGVTPMGERRIIDIVGGTFEGERLRGEILPGGADWQIVRGAVSVLEARFTMRTDDGALIYVMNHGIRKGPAEVMARLAQGEAVDPRSYSFRMSPRFETSAERYAWLNDIVAVGSGMRTPDRVIYDVYELG